MRNGGAGAAAVVVIWGRENYARHNFLRLNHFLRTSASASETLQHSSGSTWDREKVTNPPINLCCAATKTNPESLGAGTVSRWRRNNSPLMRWDRFRTEMLWRPTC
jgi:hypothetical protein